MAQRVIAAAVALALILAGCTVAGTPVPEPQRIDCDLIFPGPDGR